MFFGIFGRKMFCMYGYLTERDEDPSGEGTSDRHRPNWDSRYDLVFERMIERSYKEINFFSMDEGERGTGL